MEVEGCGPQCLERSHIRSLGFLFYFQTLTRNLLNFDLDVKLFASLLVFFLNLNRAASLSILSH